MKNDAISMNDIACFPALKIDGNTSDGYHTFNELYDHRAKLFSVIVRDHSELCWKSKQHHDGTMYDGMFIVGINTPQGQASYHYDIEPYWDMFDCREMERAPEWDGHTPTEAIDRIAALPALDMQPVHMLTVTLNDLRDEIYQDAVEHGLWDPEWTYPLDDCCELINDELRELAEAADDYECKEASIDNFCEELADVIIISLSVAGKLGIDIDAAVKRKMEINRERPYKHGKE